MGNAKEFALEIDVAFVEEMGNAREAVLELASFGLARLKERSPVAQPWNWKRPVQGYIGGQFRANWVMSLGGPDGRVFPFPGAGGVAESNAAMAAFMATEGWPVIYLQNNLPYAEALENGHSNQAPQGVAALSLLEVEAMMLRIEI